MTHSDDPKPAQPLPAWGHTARLLALEDSVPASSTADRLLFTERIARYCWAYDERRKDALARCFSEDAVWEGNVLGQVPIGPFQGRERIVTWLTEFWPHQHDQRRHMLLNTIVETQRPDFAVTLSYLLLMSSNGKRVAVETSGFYRVEYIRTPDEWQIGRLTAGFDAPFWPGELDSLSARGKARHGIDVKPPGRMT